MSRTTATTKPKTEVRRGRPLGDRDGRRSSLLAAAVAVIAREGSAGASLRKVAAEADCTTGALSYYFENKEAMLVAVVDSLFDAWEFVIGDTDDQLDIKAGFQRWLSMAGTEDPARWQASFQLLAYARNEPALAEIYHRRYSRYRRRLAIHLKRGQALGLIRSDIPASLLADQLSAMGDGWMMMRPIEPERFRPGRTQALLDAVVTMLRPVGPGPEPSALAPAAAKPPRRPVAGK